MRSFLAGLLLIGFLSTVSGVVTKFCQGIGTFSNSAPFQGLPLPKCPELLKVSFSLYTRSNRWTGQRVTRSTIPATFDGRKRTIFIVHGYLDNGRAEWVMKTTKAFLDKGDYNVIVTDWDSFDLKNLDFRPDHITEIYTQSASDTRSVGAEIGLVTANLIARANSAKSRLYCVGHSLGAHVCGHAGMRTKFGRITGLDPAGPAFADRDRTAGLNPSSADFVDVIHTDGGVGFGSVRVLGHVDFYPNGGTRQPGCLGACSHGRAHEYYVESINSPCFKSRRQCADEGNIPRSCGASPTVIQSMGFEADQYSARGKFYLTTKGGPPFCQG